MVEVLVLLNDARIPESQFNRILLWLPTMVREQAFRYKRWQDAQAFVSGRMMLAYAAKAHKLPEQVLHMVRTTEFKKPFLPGKLDFNISHSGDYVVCASSEDCRLGIDIEQISDVDLSDFVNHFTEKEMEMISMAVVKEVEFFRHWTIKEAVIKADGRGLHIPLKNVVVTDYAMLENTCWHITRLEIDDRYMAHLVINIEKQQIRLKRISIESLLDALLS